MCGRYYIEIEDDELEEIVREAEKNAQAYAGQITMKTSGEIFPTDVVPVLTATRQALPMQWGFGGIQGRSVINARSETAHDKPMFKQAMATGRCLVPASGYYEWGPKPGAGKKPKYAFRLPGGPLYLAGCYRMEKDSLVPRFVILTRQAAGGAEGIHERMPVVLPGGDLDAWLQGGPFLYDTSVTALAWQAV